MRDHLAFCIKRKDLLKQMVISRLIVGQKEMFLGYLWWILDPLLLMLIYWFLIGVIFGRGGPDYPLFILCGIVPFRAFSVSFTQSVSAISGKIGLISQINFPRVFLPLADVLANHVKLFFGFSVIIVMSLFFSIRIDYSLFYLIVPFCFQTIITVGISLCFSILGVYVNDIKNLLQFLLRALLYLSPVLYSIERIPEEYRTLYFFLNPLAPLLQTYRNIIMHNNPLDLHLIGISFMHSSVFMCMGYLIFFHNERKILKYL